MVKLRAAQIFLLFTDDIGISNGVPITMVMLVKPPNIDSIAEKGMLLTDYYAQPLIRVVLL